MPAGFSLAEVLLAVALFAVVGVCVLTLLSGGARGTARASEMQVACVIGSRVMDRLIGAGYRGVRAQVNTDGVIDLAGLRQPDDPVPSPSSGIIVDGFTYFAAAQIEEVAPGLLKIRLTLLWQRYGSPAPREPGTLSVVRYVANSALGVIES